MSQLEQDPNADGAVLTILAAALSEYRAAFAEISDEVNHGRAVTPQQLERAMAATLQLENAQTLFELDARDRLEAQQVTPPRSVH